MKCSPYVSLLVVMILTIAWEARTQTPALQKGVSVQMAVTKNAAPMPDADNEDALIVGVAADSQLYFGAKPISAEELLEQMKDNPRNRTAMLYIKADARVPFATVEKAFDAGREVGFQAAVLLTAQPAQARSGTPVPPNGLTVMIDPAAQTGSVATVVQLLNSGQTRPSLSINGDEIPWSDLESTLRRHFEKGDAKVILLKADQRLPFGQVAQAIDTCRATGAQITLDSAGV